MITQNRIHSRIHPDKLAGGSLLYLRVREQIVSDLAAGNYVSGDKYLTETELAERLDVCRNTVRKAMEHLEQEGFISRHRRIGTIVRRSPSPSRQAETVDAAKQAPQRLIVILPGWDDSTEGFYTGKLLRALSSPDLSPPLAVEIRHVDAPVTEIQDKEAAIVSIDPQMHFFSDLHKMASQGRRIIMLEPQQPIPGLINLYSDHRTVVCQAVQNFYELGHQAVGLINGSLGHLDFERSLLGYLDAHEELGKAIPAHGIVQYPSYLDPKIVPDAVNISAWVCTSLSTVDILAEQCRRAGLSIPEDVSLISLDDPGDVVMPSVGKKLSVAHNDPEAAAKLIHTYLNDWREDRCQTATFIPTRWKDRETIAPPRNQQNR
jgi:GntR family transcriptional regulator of arabinose operon